MAKSGPILLIEDDQDDMDLVGEIFQELNVKNKLLCFVSCVDALEYLNTTTDQPFIMFCDVNIPKMNGLDFKQKIDENERLRKKSIPFVYYSTSTDQASVNKAYKEFAVQGFFQKGHDYHEIKNVFRIILEYWFHCKHPNSE